MKHEILQEYSILLTFNFRLGNLNKISLFPRRYYVIMNGNLAKIHNVSHLSDEFIQ